MQALDEGAQRISDTQPATSEADIRQATHSIVQSVSRGEHPPPSAISLITAAMEREWWETEFLSGSWIAEDRLPEVRDGIDTGHFEGHLSPGREEEILAGAEPTVGERVLHRNVWLQQAFSGCDSYDHVVLHWHAFNFLADDGQCVFVIGVYGPEYWQVNFIGAFGTLAEAMDEFRATGILEADFSKWQSAKT